MSPGFGNCRRRPGKIISGAIFRRGYVNQELQVQFFEKSATHGSWRQFPNLVSGLNWIGLLPWNFLNFCFSIRHLTWFFFLSSGLTGASGRKVSLLCCCQTSWFCSTLNILKNKIIFSLTDWRETWATPSLVWKYFTWTLSLHTEYPKELVADWILSVHWLLLDSALCAMPQCRWSWNIFKE